MPNRMNVARDKRTGARVDRGSEEISAVLLSYFLLDGNVAFWCRLQTRPGPPKMNSPPHHLQVTAAHPSRLRARIAELSVAIVAQT